MPNLATKQLPTKRQIETAEIFLPLLEPMRYKGAFGGRGSGKSHFFGTCAIENSLRRPGLRGVCIREVQRSLNQSVKLLLEDTIQRLGVQPYFRVMEEKIVTPGNGVILFQGMQNHTQDTIKSLEGFDWAWVEEAQSLSQSSLTMLRPTLRSDKSEIWFSWNPRSPDDPVDKFMRDNPPNDALTVRANWSDNPWFPVELYKDMVYDRARDPSRYRHVWLGEYQVNTEALVFHNVRVDDFKAPANSIFHLGADWGFSTDPTVLVRCFVDHERRRMYIDHEVWQVGCEIENTPALFDTLIPDDFGFARRWIITADSSDPQLIDYMRRNGYPRIRKAVKGARSVEQGITFLLNYEIVVHPRCKHVIDELSSYSYRIDKRSEQVTPRLSERKNHTIDALRYALESVRRKAAEPTIGCY